MHQTKASLLIEAKTGEELKQESQDIINNLFTVCLAILNIKSKEKNGNAPLKNSVVKG